MDKTKLDELEIERIVSVCNNLFVNVELTASDIEIKQFEKGFVSSIYHVLFNKNLIEDQTDNNDDLNIEDRQLLNSGSVVVKFFPTDVPTFDILSSQINSIIAGIAYEHRIGPEVLLVKEDAIVIGFISGRLAESADDYDEKFQKLFATKMAQFHSIEVPIEKNSYKQRIVLVCDKWVPETELESLYSDDGCSGDGTGKFGEIRNILIENKCDNLLKGNYREELRFVRNSILCSDYPIVFTHGDINHSNILIVKETQEDGAPVDAIRFVDFDYSGYQYRGMDLGRYFANCKQSRLFSDEPIIDDQEMLRFINYYIDESCRIYGDSYREHEQNSPEHILKEAKLFILYAHLIDINFGLTFGELQPEKREEFAISADIRFGGYLNIKHRFQMELTTLPPISDFVFDIKLSETATSVESIDQNNNLKKGKWKGSLEQSDIEKIVVVCNQLFVDLQFGSADIDIRTFDDGFVSKIYLVSFLNNLSTQISKSSGNKSPSTINLQDLRLFESKSVVIKFFQNPKDVSFNILHSKINSVVAGIDPDTTHGSKQIGPKIFLVKNDSMAMSHISGRHANFEDDSTELFPKLLATKLAQFNSLRVPVAKNLYQSKVVSSCDDWIGESELETIYVAGEIKDCLIENNCNALLNRNYGDELKFVRDCILNSNYPIGFEHRDINPANIFIGNELQDSENNDNSPQIRLIDFDFSGYFYRGMDLGRYFASCKQSRLFSDEPIIDDQEMLRFINYYIDECCRIYGDSFRENQLNSPEHILREAKLLLLYSYIIDINFNLWVSNIETERRTEFVINADRRFSGYLVAKQRFQSEQSLPDGFN